jgi:hypothetical protein
VKLKHLTSQFVQTGQRSSVSDTSRFFKDKKKLFDSDASQFFKEVVNLAFDLCFKRRALLE